MLVGERVAVELLWSLVGPSYPAPGEVRQRQFVYAVDPDGLARGSRPRGPVWPAAWPSAPTRTVPRLSAAMYTEEMGENPMARDPDGYRRRVRMLISRGWTYVYESGGALQFKMDIAVLAATPPRSRASTSPRAPRPRGRHHRHGRPLRPGVRSPPQPVAVRQRLQRAGGGALRAHRAAREPYDFQTIMLP